jgi:hypothetical protein
MTLSDRAGAGNYERLRAEYDAAFAELRAATQKRSAGGWQEQEAMDRYRQCREALARYLADGTGFAPDAAAVESLAYRLWEEAGRPLGCPLEHWFKAERLLRRSSAS